MTRRNMATMTTHRKRARAQRTSHEVPQVELRVSGAEHLAGSRQRFQLHHDADEVVAW